MLCASCWSWRLARLTRKSKQQGMLGSAPKGSAAGRGAGTGRPERSCKSSGCVDSAAVVEGACLSLRSPRAQGMHGTFSWTRLALLLCCLLQSYSSASASPAAPAPDPALHVQQASAEHAEDGEAVDALAFFVIALLLGIFSTHMLSWTRVPYTALLLVRIRQLLSQSG